jgi:hypothetical protein
MKYSPDKKLEQCTRMQKFMTTCLVVFSVTLIVLHLAQFESWSGLTQALMVILGSASILWCFWVVRTLSHMFTWWKYMHDNAWSAQQMLASIHNDIIIIKNSTVKQDDNK